MSVNVSYLMTVPIDMGLEIIRKLPMSEMSKLLQTNKQLNDRYYPFLKAEIEQEKQKQYRINKIIDAIGGEKNCDLGKHWEYYKEAIFSAIQRFTKEDLSKIVYEFIKSGLETTDQESIEVPSTGQPLVDITTNADDLATYRCLAELPNEKIDSIYNGLREEWK